MSCSHDNDISLTPICINDSLLIVDIDNSVQLESINYSDFYSNVQAITLECDTNILIGFIDKLEAYNDYLIILDVNYSQSVFVFDKSGDFIRKIGSVGQGVGEYIGVSDFTVDSSGLLYLLDHWSQCINIYELSSGTFLRKIKINKNGYTWSYHIYKNSNLYVDTYFLKSSKLAYLLQDVDEKSGFGMSNFLNVNDYNKSWVNTDYIDSNSFYNTSGNRAFFIQQFMDTIIMISNDSIYPFAFVKYANFITDKEIDEIRKKGDNGLFPMEKLLDKNVMWNIRDIRMSDDYLFFRCWERNMQVCILYDIKMNSTYKIMSENNDVLYQENVIHGVPLKYLTSNEKGTYFCVRTSDIEMLVAYAKDNMLLLPQSQLDKIGMLSDDSNPVIIYYEYKDK